MSANKPISVSLDALSVGRSSSSCFITIFETRNPNSTDVNYPVQQRWFNTVNNSEWILTSLPVVREQKSADWQEITATGVSVGSFNVDASTAPGTNPVVPNGSSEITINGGQVAAGTTTHVVRTDSLAANTFTIEVQRSQAVGSSTVGDNGVSHFSSAQFAVDTNGFVTLAGGSTAPTLGLTPDAHTAPGTTPVIPNGSGNTTITGSQVAAGVVGTNVIRTNSLAANSLSIQIQRSQAVASTTVADNGVSHFNSAQFSVDSNGFVSLLGTSGPAFQQIRNQVFSSNGTYTPTTGMLYCSIQCLGGGGAGGGGPATSAIQCAAGGGGGAGEYAVGIFSAASIGASKAITIGAGGVGASNASGGDGGNTSVGALISAFGGQGGNAGGITTTCEATDGGDGGTGGSGGDYRSPGAPGSLGFGILITPGFVTAGGIGASSQLGSGGIPQVGAGFPGSGYGAGGGGASNIPSTGSSTAGGNGSAGVVIVTEYI